MKREIALDTETTGFDWKNGERIIEIGAVEMINRIPTGKTFHKFVNPEGRKVSEGALKVHGITNEFLEDKQPFSELADEFLEFIEDGKLIIHNAQFDIGFLNAELMHVKKPEIETQQYFCTLIHARRTYPGAQNSLDALCRRFNIDNSHRTYHGALLDSEILAEVYLELMGGAQIGIGLNDDKKDANSQSNNDKNEGEKIVKPENTNFPKREFKVSDEELSAHNNMVDSMKDSLWKNYS